MCSAVQRHQSPEMPILHQISSLPKTIDHECFSTKLCAATRWSPPVLWRRFKDGLASCGINKVLIDSLCEQDCDKRSCELVWVGRVSSTSSPESFTAGHRCRQLHQRATERCHLCVSRWPSLQHPTLGVCFSRHFSASVDLIDSARGIVYLGCGWISIVWMDMLMQLWRPLFELVGISSGIWYHFLPIRTCL